MRKNINPESGAIDIIIVVAIVALIIGGIGYYVYQRNFLNKPNPQSTASPTKAAHPGVVQKLQFGNAIDPKTGMITTSAASFNSNDNTIYMGVMLQNAKKGSRIEFVRYVNNFFIDNGGVTVTKDGAQMVTFAFSAKPGKSHPVGTYKIKVYTNGIYETAGAYSVQ